MELRLFTQSRITRPLRYRRDAHSPRMTADMSAWLSMDKEAARVALKAAGVKLIGGPFLDFRDPWGNRIEIVGYENIQFTKAPNVLRGMGLAQLTENESAQKELAEKGMAEG
jgi:hypothetical protein